MSINNIFERYYENIENDNSNIREIVCFVLFCIGVITVSCFHEPWFDEFQALQISKDNLYNILFVIPHFEGHPPLWHIILKCFSYFNIPAELCIKIPNLLFIISAVWLLIFKSPFPRLVRLVLPFTYFLFYQYAVVSRPYSMLICVLFVVAILYKNKNSCPFKFILSLVFLSLTSAFGIVISVGIVLSWIFEIWNRQNPKTFFKTFLKDKRFWAVLGLFCCYILLALELMPSTLVTAQTSFGDMNIFAKCLYFMFGIPADATITNILNYGNIFSINIFQDWVAIIGIFYGVLLVTMLIYTFKKYNKLIFFLLNYLLFVIFSTCIYLWPTHIGIFTILLIYLFWCLLEETKNFNLNKLCMIILIATLCVQLYWSSCAIINEIRYNYAPSREISNFIKQYDLTQYKIMSEWLEDDYWINNNRQKIYNKTELNKNEKYEQKSRINTNCQAIPVIINPYFNKNIFYNFNLEYPNKLYKIQAIKTPEAVKITKSLWKEKGIPDIIVGDAKVNKVWDKSFTLEHNYILIKHFWGGIIWKNDDASTATTNLYAHKNLYDKFKYVK